MGVTGDHDRLEVIKELGATAIDYTAATAEEYIAQHTDGEGFDIVFDTVGEAHDAVEQRATAGKVVVDIAG